MLEAVDVDGQGGQDLQDAIEKHPPAQAGFARCEVLEVSGELELFEPIYQRRS